MQFVTESNVSFDWLPSRRRADPSGYEIPLVFSSQVKRVEVTPNYVLFQISEIRRDKILKINVTKH